MLNKKWSIVLTLVIIFSVFSTLSVVSYAQFYDSSYDSTVGYVQSGKFLVGPVSLDSGNRFDAGCIIWTPQMDDSIIISLDNFYNCSNSTIYTTFINLQNGTYYPCRFSARSNMQINTTPDSMYATWDGAMFDEITDTNVDFDSYSEFYPANNNLYFDKFQIAVLAVLIAILFFEFMGWYLLHKIH